jgi:hypothetical protein
MKRTAVIDVEREAIELGNRSRKYGTNPDWIRILESERRRMPCSLVE